VVFWVVTPYSDVIPILTTRIGSSLSRPWKSLVQTLKERQKVLYYGQVPYFFIRHSSTVALSRASSTTTLLPLILLEPG
jgi:hypothetical protein